jgi:RimJ/RimL family protein N-acetyltransferase
VNILESDRLTLSAFSNQDAEFLLQLMNQPDYHRYIGDRGLRTLADAEKYIRETIVAAYKDKGFGFWVLKRKNSGGAGEKRVGFAGIIKRDELDRPDVGYAITKNAAGNGYAQEITAAVLAHARDTLKLKEVCAITNSDNDRSINVLIKNGFVFETQSVVFEDGEQLNIYRRDLL